MKKLRGRALVVDDQIVWLELFTELLQELGLEVDCVDNCDIACQLLKSRYYHLALVDVRLRDDEPQNKEGMKVLAYIDDAGLCDVVTKIVVTGYGTREWAREAFKKFHVHDFIPKQGPDGKGFDEEDFVSSVETAFKERVNVNLNLDIKYIHGLSLDEMVREVIPYPAVGEQSPILRWELDDLFRKLFPGAESIILSRLPDGRSGAAVVRAEPFYQGRGQAEAVIVKYSAQIAEIELEVHNFGQFVKGFVAGGRHTDLERSARTRSFAGIVYSFIGASTQRVHSLSEFYISRDVSVIRVALDDLFQRTCGKWYENRQFLVTRNLAELYWQEPNDRYKNILRSFEQHFPQYVSLLEIELPGIAGSLVNPVYHPFVIEKHINLPVHTSITHGDLNGENVFVDEEYHTWMIDFARSSVRHILCDFITLESAVKFQFLTSDSLNSLFEFERAILFPDSFGTELVVLKRQSSPEIVKALAVINHLRTLALSVILPNRDIRAYYAGLLYHTLNLFRYPFIMLSEKRKYHVLLSAALLCARLEDLIS